MILEITIGVIALTFIILVIFLILALRDARRTIKKTDKVLTEIHKTLDAISEPSKHLIQNVDKLTQDIRKKSEGLDVLFLPLYALHKKKAETSLLECVGEAISLFQKIKNKIIS